MSEPTSEFAAELEAAMLAATEAGGIVRAFYDDASARTYEKDDGSFVTDADLAADRAIRATLAARFPDDQILTEEGIDDPERLNHARCWLVDPIDGTDQFIHRTGDFDVLVALVVDGRPVVAAGFNPPTGLLCAAEQGRGAWLRDGPNERPRPFSFTPHQHDATVQLATSFWFGAPENSRLVERIGRRVDTARLEPLKIGFTPRIFLPPRPVDAYLGIRLGNDHSMGWEWDFAVADLFIREAGGLVTDLSGSPHRYNKPLPRNLNGLIAARDAAIHQRLLAAVQTELALGLGASPHGPDPPEASAS